MGTGAFALELVTTLERVFSTRNTAETTLTAKRPARLRRDRQITVRPAHASTKPGSSEQSPLWSCASFSASCFVQLPQAFGHFRAISAAYAARRDAQTSSRIA